MSYQEGRRIKGVLTMDMLDVITLRASAVLLPPRLDFFSMSTTQ
jgi:hypothetical protein